MYQVDVNETITTLSREDLLRPPRMSKKQPLSRPNQEQNLPNMPTKRSRRSNMAKSRGQHSSLPIETPRYIPQKFPVFAMWEREQKEGDTPSTMPKQRCAKYSFSKGPLGHCAIRCVRKSTSKIVPILH